MLCDITYLSTSHGNYCLQRRITTVSVRVHTCDFFTMAIFMLKTNQIKSLLINYFYYLNIDTSTSISISMKVFISRAHKLREFTNERIISLAGLHNEIHLSTEIHKNTATILVVSTLRNLSNQIYAKYCI